MSGFEIGFRAKIQFFDTKPVRRRLAPKLRKFLSRFGAYTRQQARTSIRKPRKDGKASRPGEPPRNQTGTLKKSILFGFDSRRESVVIGPIIAATKYGGAETLEALEEGGSTIAAMNVPGGGKRKKRIQIKARPFIGPAFEDQKRNISSIWKSS